MAPGIRLQKWIAALLSLVFMVPIINAASFQAQVPLGQSMINVKVPKLLHMLAAINPYGT